MQRRHCHNYSMKISLFFQINKRKTFPNKQVVHIYIPQGKIQVSFIHVYKHIYIQTDRSTEQHKEKTHRHIERQTDKRIDMQTHI